MLNHPLETASRSGYWSGFGKVAIALAIALTCSGCYSAPTSQAASPMSSSPQPPASLRLAGLQPSDQIDRPIELALPQAKNNYSQGIRGQVRVLQGNQMPTIDAPKTGQRGAIHDIPVRLWVFAGKVQPVAGPRLPISVAKQLDRLAGWTVSDPNGQFEMGLPVGEYTVFLEQGQDLYLNSFVGDGSFASTSVLEGEVTEIQIVNSENAVF